MKKLHDRSSGAMVCNKHGLTTDFRIQKSGRLICRPCSRAYKSRPEVRARERDHVRSYLRAYEARPDQRAKKKERYLRNRERTLAYMRAYSQRPEVREREQLRAVERWKKPEYREYHRVYGRLHPEHDNASWHLYRARKIGATSEPFNMSGAYRALKSIGRCAYCLQSFCSRELTIDHVVPLARGGAHAPGNLVPACQKCNFTKNAKLRQPLFMPLPSFVLSGSIKGA